MYDKEVCKEFKASLANNKISNSGDFIIELFNIFSDADDSRYKPLEPLIEIELYNELSTRESNVVHSMGLINKIQEPFQLKELREGYLLALDVLLLIDGIGDAMHMHEIGSLGHKIYKELDAKYNHTNLKYREMVYKQSKQ